MIGNTPDLTFLVDDHPEACGKIAAVGAREYCLYFTLENQTLLCVKMGLASYNILQSFIKQMAIDDEIDAALEKDC